MRWPFSKKTEIRADEVSWDLLSTSGFPTSASGVTPTQAENLATVLACVQVISSSIASLPAYVYRRTPQGREVVTDHPLSRMITAGPNDHQTWCDFIESVMGQALLNGNALTLISEELIPIPWANVSYEILKSSRIRYRVLMPGTNEHRVLIDDD